MKPAFTEFCMNFSTEVIQEVSELNLDLHAGAGKIFECHCGERVWDE